MASNLEKFGGYIKGKVTGAVSDFAYGAKAAAVSANPAVFGKMEQGITSLTNSFKKSREDDNKKSRDEQAEKRRARGFQEEQAREQKYADLLQLKMFEEMNNNLEKILKSIKDLTKDQEDSWFDKLKLFLAMHFGKITTALTGLLAAIKGLPGHIIKAISDLLSGLKARITVDLPRWFKNFKFPEFKMPTWLRKFLSVPDWMNRLYGKMPSWIKSLTTEPRWLRSLRGFKWPELRMPSWMDDFLRAAGRGSQAIGRAAQSVGEGARAMAQTARGAAAPFVAGAALGISKLPSLPIDGVMGKVTDVVDTIITQLYVWFDDAMKAIGSFKIPEGAIKLLRNIPIIGTIIGFAVDAVEGFFNTERLQEVLGQEEISIWDRVKGALGGILGSIPDFIIAAGAFITSKITGQDYDDIIAASAFGQDDYFRRIGITIVDWVSDWFGGTIDYIIGWLTGNEELQEVGETQLALLIDKVMKPLKLVAFEMTKVIEGWFYKIHNFFIDVEEFFAGIAHSWEQSKTELVWKMEDGAAWALNSVVGAVYNLWNMVVGAVNGFIDTIITKINALTDSEWFQYVPGGQTLRDKAIQALTAAKMNEVTAPTFTGETSGEERKSIREGWIAEAGNMAQGFESRRLYQTEEGLQAERDKVYGEAEDLTEILENQLEEKKEALAKKEEEERLAREEELRRQEELDRLNEVKEGVDNTARNATDISVTEQELAEIRSNKELDHQTRLNEEMRRAYEVGVNKMLAGQSQLVQSLLGPLLKGQGGEGGLGTFFKNIFGDDSPLGGIGDALGNLFGKGKGGWFDGLTGWFKDNLGGLSEFGSAVGDLFKVGSGTSVGTSIFSTPGFGGGTPAGMNPIAALFGSKLSSELGLTGVGANAAFDVAQSLFTSGTGMAGVKSALAGPGGFAGGLGAIMSIFGGDSTTLGGALSGGLGIYQLLKGGGLSNMLGGGIAKLGAQMFTAGATGLGSSFMGFGTGMTDPTMLFQKNALLSERLGAGAGAIGTGFTAKAIGDFLSGGYTANKYLTTAGGVLAGIGATGALGPLLAAGPAGIVIGVVAGLANRLFGRKAKEYTDIGMDLDIGTNTTGQVYKDWIKKGGAYRSDKRGTEYENLDTGLVEYFNESASAIQDAYGKLAETMGLSAEAIVGFTKSFSVSLKDLSPAEQQRKIAELVQQYADAAITSSYGNISRFAIEGEKTTDTFVRMASAVENVSYWFDALGYSVEETKDMFTKMVDAQGLATPAVSGFFNIDWMNSPYYQQMMAEYQSPDYAGGRAGAYMYDAGLGIPYLGPEYFAAIYAQQEQAAADFVPTEEQMNLAIAGAQANFIEMFGGQQQFGQYMQGYFSNFYTPQEQAEFMARQSTIQAQEQLAAVQDQLDEMGLAPELSQQLEGITSREQIDAAKEEFRKAVEAAMEEGNMDLAAQLIMSGETFIQAAEMQLRAAEMNGEAAVAAGDYMIQDTGAGGGGITGSSTELNTAKWTAGGSGTGGDASVVNGNNVQSGTGGTNQSGASVILTPISSGGNAYNNSTVNNVTVQDGVRNYHPILSIDVRGTTSGFLGLGSR